MRIPTLNVAFFTNHTSSEADIGFARLISNLDRSRFQPLLIARPEQISALQSKLPVDVETIPFKRQKLNSFMEALRLWHVLRSHDVDILHTHQLYAGWFAAPVARMNGIAVILDAPGTRRKIEETERLYQRAWRERQSVVGAYRDSLRRLSRAG